MFKLKKRVRFLILSNLLLICIVGASFFPYSVYGDQESNPFYRDLFDEGERAFLQKNYKNAIKELEIAVFGLQSETGLMCKAYLYMGLSYYYLGESGNSRKYLGRAVESIKAGECQILDLKIQQSERVDFQRIMDEFNLGISLQQEEPGETVKKAEVKEAQRAPVQKKMQEETIREPPPKKAINDPVQELEGKIRSNPGNISLYYELYELHRRNNNIRAAKEALRNLIKQNPIDAKAFILLARIDYQEKKYRETEQNCEEILKISRNVPVEESVKEEAIAYLILSAHSREDRVKAQRILKESNNILSSSKVRSLPLSIQEKRRLQEIIGIYSTASQYTEEGFLTGVILHKTGNFLEIEIQFEPYISHSIFEYSDVKKFGVDLMDLKGNRARSSIEVNDFGIKGIRTGMYQSSIARVVFDVIDKIPPYKIEKSMWGLKIIISRIR